MDGPLRFWIVRSVPSVVEVKAVFREAAWNLAELPKGIVIVSIIEAATLMPPDEVRASLARHNEELAQHTLASVVVAEGGLFRLASLRALIAGVGMIKRRRFPESVQGSVEDAAQWLLPLTAQAYPEVTHARIVSLASATRKALED